MTPSQLKSFLDALVRGPIRLSTMIWGPPGIGKSSVVSQVASGHGLQFIDLRLSQLAPTDLRGLPVPENGISKWYPPEFLPREGSGVLFLDELNMAPPAVQGIAQQLILDRKVGSYELPEAWFVWAAGNRKEDRAAVFDMPSPLANRFLHLDVGPDFDAFRVYALERSLDERVMAFLSFRPTLLHKIDPQRPAWPSPRSWEMASRLRKSGLDVAPAVGDAAAAEFGAFEAVYRSLPELGPVLEGDGQRVSFPNEPSTRYAIAVGLAMRSTTATHGLNAFRWMREKGSAEWVQLLLSNLFVTLRSRGQLGELLNHSRNDQELRSFLTEFRALLSGQA